MDDGCIIELYFNRNEHAIKETEAKYGRYLYTIANNILHNPYESEESVNDTYLDAWNAIPPHRPNKLKNFLSVIVRRIAVDTYRKKSSQKRIPSEFTVSISELDDCIGETFSLDEEQLAHEIARVMSTYLRAVSDKRRCIFISRYYTADSIADIADFMSISESAVYKELAAIRKELKATLIKEGISV